jgi:polyisoprenyl-phosphate glycosyltransferase
MKDISVIIPVYNGSKTLENLLEKLKQNLKTCGSFEILFVYDRGSDNSWEILKKLQIANSDEVRLFKLKRNYGQHNAIIFGITKSLGQVVITMDEDLQHDPYYLYEMLKLQRQNNYDVVYARFKDSQHPFFRKVASIFLQKLLKLLIPGLNYYSSFRVIKRDKAFQLTLIKKAYTFIDASFISMNLKFGYLEIEHRKNAQRKSTYTVVKLALHVIQIILAYSRITLWTFFFSVLFIFVALISKQFTFLEAEIRKDFSVSGIILFIIAISGVLYHKWKERTNSLPIIAIESF